MTVTNPAPAETPAPTLSRFERLMIAVALRELADHQQQVRGLISHVEKLAKKFDIDEDLWRRADQWIASTRR